MFNSWEKKEDNQQHVENRMQEYREEQESYRQQKINFKTNEQVRMKCIKETFLNAGTCFVAGFWFTTGVAVAAIPIVIILAVFNALY